MKNHFTADYADYPIFRDYIKNNFTTDYADYADFRDYIKNNFTTDYADLKDYVRNTFPVTFTFHVSLAKEKPQNNYWSMLTICDHFLIQ